MQSHLIGSNQVRERERVRSDHGLGRATWGSRGLGFAAAWVVGLIFPGFFSLSSSFFFFSFSGSDFFFAGVVVLLYMGL